jgi:transposase-like protein
VVSGSDVFPAIAASMIVGLSRATTRKEAPAIAGADRMTIEEVVKGVMVQEHGDLVRAAVEAVCAELMEGEVAALIGAELGERRPEDRMTHRNGYRAREWQTGAGTVELRIPKLRRGSYFPSFLEPRRRSEQALLSVVQQAYVCGVSTRRVDQLVESLGLRISKSEVSRVCQALDEHVEAFRTRPLEGAYPYLFLDAKVEKVRDGGRVVNKALVIAHGVHETGRREILSIDVGEAETEAFWITFLRSLVKRGLVGVQLAISDAHAGLKAAIAKVLGCSWQRCTVHFLRDCLGHARRDQHGLLAALIRPIFNADSHAQARDRLSEAVAHLDGRLSKVAAMLEDAEPDILAFYAFPPDHWRKLRSTNPLERFNREIGRRTDVVGIFPDDAALVRLAGMLCIEQNDEWLVGRRYLSAESISLALAGRDDHIDNEINEEVAQLQPA